MATKISMLVILGILALQGVVQSKYINHQHADVQDFLENVKQITKHSIANLTEAFEKLIQDIQNEVQKGQANIDQVARTAQNEISHFKSSAEEVAVDISECTTVHQIQINELIRKVGQQVVDCTKQVLSELTELWSTALDAIHDHDKKIQEISLKFGECYDWACVARVQMEINEEIASAKETVRAIIDKGITQVTKSLPSTVECIRDVLAPYTAEIKALVDEIKRCVDDKMEAAIEN